MSKNVYYHVDELGRDSITACALKKALTNRVALLFKEPCTFSDPLQIHFLCKHSSFSMVNVRNTFQNPVVLQSRGQYSFFC